MQTIECKRVQWLDFGKGFLIIFVILGHVLGKWIGDKNVLVEKIHSFIYLFHMPAFLLISGYSWKLFRINKVVDTKKYILHRGIALLVPYAIFEIGYGTMKVLLGSGNWLNPITFSDVLLFLVKPFDYPWFLYVLFILECMALFWEKSNWRKKNNIAIICGMVMHIFSYLVIDFEWLAINRLLWLMIFFFLGILWNDNEKEEKIKYLLEALFAVSIVCYFILRDFKLDAVKIVFERSICAYLGAICYLLFFKNIKDANLKGKQSFQIICLLGRYSMVFYLVHQPIISIIRVILIETNWISPICQIAFMFGGTLLVSTCICWVATRVKWIEMIFYPGKYIRRDK